MNDATITALQAVVVGAMVFAGQWVVARLSKKAQSEQTDVDSQGKAVEAWESYSRTLTTRLESLERRFAEAERKHEEDRRAIRRLERERENDRDLIRRLVFRLRWALAEIKRLGGEVPAHYDTLADDAALRVDRD